MATLFTIELPKEKKRNPLVATCQGKTQVMRDRRNRRAKDARKSWKREDW
jgi:hypothetical protein